MAPHPIIIFFPSFLFTFVHHLLHVHATPFLYFYLQYLFLHFFQYPNIRPSSIPTTLPSDICSPLVFLLIGHLNLVTEFIYYLHSHSQPLIFCHVFLLDLFFPFAPYDRPPVGQTPGLVCCQAGRPGRWVHPLTQSIHTENEFPALFTLFRVHRQRVAEEGRNVVQATITTTTKKGWSVVGGGEKQQQLTNNNISSINSRNYCPMIFMGVRQSMRRWKTKGRKCSCSVKNQQSLSQVKLLPRDQRTKGRGNCRYAAERKTLLLRQSFFEEWREYNGGSVCVFFACTTTKIENIMEIIDFWQIWRNSNEFIRYCHDGREWRMKGKGQKTL